MSVTRSRLTKAEIIENVASAKKMQALGSHICIPPEWLRVAEQREQQNAKLEIQQVGIHDSMIFELDSGRAGCILDLRLTNHTSRPMYVDTELRLPWHDEMLDWLMPAEIPLHFRGKPDRSYRAYRFPGKLAMEFPCEEVLNQCLIEGGCLPTKRPVRGLLLATGGPLPADLKHGQWLDVALALIDSDHNEYIQTIKLWTERLELRPSVMVRTRTRLRDDLGSSTNGAVADVAAPSPMRLPVRDSETRVLGADLEAGRNNIQE